MDEQVGTVIRLLSIPVQNRTSADIVCLHAYLRTIEGLNIPGPTSAHRDAELRAICRVARHQHVSGEVTLYQAGDYSDCWFILLTGSVLIDSSMFLPRACFGTRINGATFRQSGCIVLEPSDLVVIDYPESDRCPGLLTDFQYQAVMGHKRRLSTGTTSSTSTSSDTVLRHNQMEPVPVTNNTQPSQNNTSLTLSPGRGKRSVGLSPANEQHLSPCGGPACRFQQLGDTSSAQSFSSSLYGSTEATSAGAGFSDSGRGSSRVTSVVPEKKLSSTSSPSDTQKVASSWSKHSGGTGDSSLVDSEDDEEEEDFESSSHESLRDAFWESILKDPSERTAEDIEILLENVQQLPAFSNLTKATCRSLCTVMVVAIVREAGQVVLGDNEPLDTWAVVLNGTVEVIEPDGTIRELTRGDAFGVRPGREDRTHRGVMRTVTEDCQFACVPQADYLQIMSREGEAEIPEMGEGGRVVLVYEALETDTSTVRPTVSKSMESTTAVLPKKGRVVTKGTPEKLIEHLVADLSNVDVTYPEDFLLTYRTFLESPAPIVDRLLSWHMHAPHLRARVNRIVILWVHNHFNDFEDSPEMMKFVEKFDRILVTDGTAGERRLFQLACSTKARPRQIELELPLRPVSSSHSNSSPTHLVHIPFTLLGGQDGFGIFVDQVDPQFATALETNSWNPSGTSSPQTVYPTTPSRPQIRRADQLLAVNGRSVKHYRPVDVVRLIHALGSAAAADFPGVDIVDTSNPVFTLRLLFVYNPLQYHQLVNTLDSRFLDGLHLSDQNHSGLTGSLQPVNADTIDVIDGQSRKTNIPSNGRGSGPTRSSRPLSPASRGSGESKSVMRGRRAPETQQQNGNLRSSANPNHLPDPQDRRSGRSHSAHTSPIRISSGKQRSSLDTNCGGPDSAVRMSSEQPGLTASSDAPGINDNQTISFLRTPSTTTAHEDSCNLLYSPPPFHRTQRSSSQPDLSVMEPYAPDLTFNPPSAFLAKRPTSDATQCNDQSFSVIRVWRSNETGRDQTSKLVLLPHRHTNALLATRLAAEEFGVLEEDMDCYSLYHVTVDPGPIVKQSRLANTVDDLAGRMTLNARYYLRHNRSHDTLIADDVAKAILAESRVTFLQLTPEDLAIRVTLDDYEVFRAVQSTEYIDEVFGLSPAPSCLSLSDAAVSHPTPTGYATGHGNLDRFTELVNREAYWAPTEICMESNLNRRVDLIKRFIKLAKLCRDLRNFNTMFCILVGLHQTPVERLKQTWERLPNKYFKMYRDLSMVLDTSRNFFQYRNMLTGTETAAPMLPYLPLVLKDLTFIHLGNPSRSSDGLINFVKLRMLAKEIRAICRMCNVEYDIDAAHRLLRRFPVGSRARAWTSASKSTTLPPKANSFATNGLEHNSFGEDMKRNSETSEDQQSSSGRSVGSRAPSLSLGTTKRSTSQATSFGSVILNVAATAGGSPLLSLPGSVTSFAGRRRSTAFTFGSSATTFPSVNTKKLYESWLTTLRIRTYIANLVVNQDSESLSQLSVRLEPGSREVKASAQPTATTANGSNSNTNVGAVVSWSTESLGSTPTAVSACATKSPSKTCATTMPTCPPVAEKSMSSTSPTTSVPCTSTSVTVTSPTPLARPFLGAHSVEDASKLRALSECRKRSQHRIPSFTLPTNTCVFAAPTSGPHAGIGLGQLQYQHHPSGSSHRPNQYYSQNSQGAVLLPNTISNLPPCQNPHHRHPTQLQHPHQHHPSTSYAIVGSKALSLDYLIPMPRRIGPACTGAAVWPGLHQHQQAHASHFQRMPSSNTSNSRGLPAHTTVTGGSNPMPISQMRPVQNTRPTSDKTFYATPPATSVRQKPSSQLVNTYTSSGGVVHRFSPQAKAQAVGGPTPFTHFTPNGGVHIVKSVPVNMRPQYSNSDESYYYPTANMNPYVDASQQHRQFPIGRNGQAVDWKPNRPPPYELALALRQQQQSQVKMGSRSTAGSQLDEQQRRQSSTSETNSRRQQTPLTRGSSSDTPQTYSRHAMPPRQESVDLERSRRNPPRQPYHPPGAPRPAMDVNTELSDGQSRGSSQPLSSTRSTQRPAPPSYHQVVAMTRYTQQQPAQNIPTRPSGPCTERPTPPTRTVATLSSASQNVSTRSASAHPGPPAIHSNSSVPNALESHDPHKPRRSRPVYSHYSSPFCYR
ncbi:hypothetical protein CRM22_008499 [Opisthorchis felineus]|uniref:Rap guanine nucleotide exchange factor 2 n=2 Tax=Opisthorchis felineus TaxID=147828 RepID=A0A4S2LJ61_OPIFE|nr:hypothetical protein CRM22_008499 [Opisthorchis felineus]